MTTWPAQLPAAPTVASLGPDCCLGHAHRTAAALRSAAADAATAAAAADATARFTARALAMMSYTYARNPKMKR
eukprot:9571677-Alexandrium_andersonii.AAC.1